MIDRADVIGVAPMAGRGTRLGLSVSKEIASLVRSEGESSSGAVLSDVMLTRMSEAGIKQAVLTVASHKQDVQDHFGSRFGGDFILHYVSADESPNTPTSIDAGYALLKGKVCALGFADILYQPCAGYARAISLLEESAADVVLGLFPTTQPTTVDMVAFDATGQVSDILIKQAAGARLFYTWSLAVWRPTFTEFMHDWLQDSSRFVGLDREVFVGDALVAALAAGLKVHAVPVSALASLDAGTPETLALARSVVWRMS